MQRKAGLDAVQVDAEHLGQLAQTFVERGPAEPEAMGRQRLVAAAGQIRAEGVEQVRTVLFVEGDQAAQLALVEGLDANVLPEEVQQSPQADVGHLVVGLGGVVVPDRLAHLLGLAQRAPDVTEGVDSGTDSDHDPARAVTGSVDGLGEARQAGPLPGGQPGEHGHRGRAATAYDRLNPRVASRPRHPLCEPPPERLALGRVQGLVRRRPHHAGHQQPVLELDAEGPGPGLELRRGVGAADDVGQQPAMTLPLQRLSLPFDQPVERDRDRGAFDHGPGAVGRRGVAGAHRQLTPVLAASPHLGDEPEVSLTDQLGPAGPRRPSADRRPGRQMGVRLIPGVQRQHLVAEVLEEHRPLHHGRGAVDDLGCRRTLEGEFGEDVVDRLAGPDLVQLRLDDQGVCLFGDLDEPDLAAQDDDRQVEAVSRRDHGGRRGGEAPAQLDDEAAGAGPGQALHVAREGGSLGGKRDAGGQQQLPAVQEARDVGELADVDPAHLVGQRLGPGDHQRVAGTELGEPEQDRDGGECQPVRNTS